jgi:Ca-activated chloride channel family protein
MVHFQSSIYLAFGLFGLLIIAAFWAYSRWRKRVLMGIKPVFYPIIFTKNPLKKTYALPALQVCVVLCMAVMLASPQWGSETKKQRRTGVEIIFVVDISNSMLAADQLPNRIYFAREIMELAVKNLQENRIGIVLYAAETYTLLPLTTDIDAILLQINEIYPTLAATQGSYSSRAIDLASEMFEKQQKNLRNKAIFLISDGEDMQGNAAEAATNASDKGIMVCTIGVGTTQGTNIITIDDKIKMDENNKEVITKMQPEALKQIATNGKGSYYHATNADAALSFIQKNIQTLQKNSFETTTITQTKVRFQIFIGIVLLLMVLIEFFWTSDI